MRAESLDRPRVLLLHGLWSSGESKAAFLRSLGYDVRVPRLLNWSFPAALRIAQDAFNEFKPGVVVGSSRGGALALHLEVSDRPMILLAPAYKFFGGLPDREPLLSGSVVIHSHDDPLVPYRHSVELVRKLSGSRLVAAGQTHQLNCPGGRAALRRVVRDFVPLYQMHRPA